MANTKAAGKAGKNTNHWLILVLLALAQFMVVLDVSIVNVALPAIQNAFHMSQSNLQWIITMYTLDVRRLLAVGRPGSRSFRPPPNLPGWHHRFYAGLLGLTG